MKTKVYLGIAVVALVLAGIAAGPSGVTHAGPQTSPADSLRIVNVELLGLKEQRVEKARTVILSVPGVQDVEFNVAKRSARIKFDIDKTNLRTLEQRLRKASFTPVFH